jgi:hypothetical protein
LCDEKEWNGMPRKTFGPKTEEVKGGWRHLHNEELHALQSFPDIRVIKLRRMSWGCMGDERNAYRIVVGKPEGTSVLGWRGIDVCSVKVEPK